MMRGASTQLQANRSTRGVAPGTLAPGTPSQPVKVDGARGRGSDFQWMQKTLTRVQEELNASREAEELHRLLFEKVPYPRFVCDAQTFRFLEANEAAVRAYGYSREEFRRMRLTDLNASEENADVRDVCHDLCPADRGRVNKAVQLFRHRKQDGTVIDVEMDSALVALHQRSVFLLLAQDVTERRRADQRLHAQHATTQALAESSTLSEASPRIFQAICENLGCDWGELWRVDPAAQVLRCTQTWHPGKSPLPELERVVRRTVLARGEGIAGTAWAQNKPVWISDVTSNPRLQKPASVFKHGLRAVFAFPIRLNQEVLGVIVVFSRDVRPPDKHLLRMFRDVCSQIGQVMGRRRAERQLLEISEQEQRRIGQDLHDGLCQQLTGIAYMCSDLQTRLSRRALPEAESAARIGDLLRETATQARQLARGLNPVKLGTAGLMASLVELTSSIQSMFSISCRFECRHRVLIQHHETAVHLYRIVQEAIHNAVTHGKATQIVVTLSREPEGIIIRVTDNGRGPAPRPRTHDGMGLENMNYRTRAIGAKIQLTSRAGGGAVLTCTLPPQKERPL